jgi:hypothetical protein
MKMMNLRWRFVGFGCGVLGLVLAGCSSIGPGTVSRDRVDYVGAMSDSWKQQTLLNIVMLRYGDAPTFMDVSSVIASYAFIGTANAGAAVNLEGDANPVTFPKAIGTFGISGTYLDRPTISFTPLSGDKFTRNLLRPIPPSAIFSLIAAGYPADLMLQITTRALNGVYNRSSAAATRPADPEFYPLLDALRRIQLSESMSLRVEKQGKNDVASIVFAGHLTPEIQKDIAFVSRTLKLTTKDGNVLLTYGALQRSGHELAVLSRSMIEILQEFGAQIEVPINHVSSGRTLANVQVSAGDQLRDRPIIHIHVGTTSPGNTFTAVHYGDSWYWIEDGDFYSKRAFTFLLLFFSLLETGVQPQVPILTLPLQ